MTPNDVRRLATELAVANTGSYVFRRFADDPIVKAMALRSETDLLDAVKAADAAPTPIPLDIEVAGYAAAIALLLGQGLATLEAYGLLRQSGLKWLPQIIETARADRRPRASITSLRQNDYAFNFSPTSVTMSTSRAPGNLNNENTESKIILFE
jgi:hypothetical protein